MAETTTTKQTHEFLPSGCRYQWFGEHDPAGCWAAFLNHHGAPAGIGIDEFYDGGWKR